MEQLRYSLGKHPHQLNSSPLTKIGVGLVSCFPLNYMHLVCLGVVRRMLNFFTGAICGTQDGKMSDLQVAALNGTLVKVKLLSEFNRQPRSLAHLKYWKATEFRSFVLYSGMVVLRDVLSPSMYKHFLSLSLGVRFLCESSMVVRDESISSARELLEYFVWGSENHYGALFNVYNVHGLIFLMTCNISTNHLMTFRHFRSKITLAG